METWGLFGIWVNTIVLLAVGVVTVVSLRKIAEALGRVEETAARGERKTAEILTRLASSTVQ
jgi:hypothetical protein